MKNSIAFFVVYFLLSCRLVQAESIKTENHLPFVYQSVNVITGEYCENQTDLHLGGPVPLSLKRFYSTLDTTSNGWRFNHPNIFYTEKEFPDEWSEKGVTYQFDAKARLKNISIKDPGRNQNHHEFNFEYIEDQRPAFVVTADDGKKIKYTFKESGTSRNTNSFVLEHVLSSDGMDITYDYAEHPSQRRLVVTKRQEPNGRYLLSQYYNSFANDVDGQIVTISDPSHDIRLGRVKVQKAPVGHDETPITTAKFFYYPGYTVVFDALGNKTIYHYGDNQKLERIEQYSPQDLLYRVEKFFWDSQDLMISRTTEDGAGNVLKCQTFIWNLNGALLKSTLWGDLSGNNKAQIILDADGRPIDNGVESYSTSYRYSEDNSALVKLIRADNGKQEKFDYLPGTDKVLNKFTYSGSKLKIREFYNYDQNNDLIEVIVDDGSSEDKQNLAGVTQRQITTFKNKQKRPGIGMPEVVEQKFLDLKTGETKLIQRKELTYSASQQVIEEKIFDQNGNFIIASSVEYNSKGLPTNITNSFGKQKVMSYDLHGNLLSALTEDELTENRYDFSNRLIESKQTFADGKINRIQFIYDYNGNKIASRDHFGNQTDYTYDFLNRLVKTTSPEVMDSDGNWIKPVTEQKYNALNQVVSSTNALGHTTQTRYNVRGQPTKITYPDGTFEIMRYNLDGTLEKTITRTGLVIHYTHDFLDRETKQVKYAPDGTLIGEKHSYYSSFHLLSETDENGITKHYTYDGAGRVNLITTTDHQTTCLKEITYNLLGQIESEKTWTSGDSNAIFTQRIRSFDQSVEKVVVQDSKGTVFKEIENENQANSFPVIYHYDHYNEIGQNVLKTTAYQEDGVEIVTFFDAIERPVTIEKFNVSGQLVFKKEIAYDAESNKAKEIFSGYEVQWFYGPNNRLEKTVEAAGSELERVTLFKYNNNGLISSVIKPDGVIIYYQYNPKRQLKRVFSSDRSIDYLYAYNDKGQIIQEHDQILKTKSVRQYDSQSRLIQEVLGNGLEIKNRFDKKGRKTALTLPDQSTIQYNWSDFLLQSVEKISDGQTLYEHSYDYDMQGRVKKSSMIANLGSISYDFDQDDRLTTIQSNFWSQTLEYDQLGLPARFNISDPTGDDILEISNNSQRQVTKESGFFNNTYNYDENQNITGKNDTNYQIDQLNQLTHVGEQEYLWDYNGNLISDGKYQYKWDALNRLIEIYNDNQCITRFSYDSSSRRLSKTSFSLNGEEKTELYLYDGNNEIAQTDEQGNICQLRVLGAGLGAEMGAAIAIEIDGQLFAPIHDHRGSVICLVDAKTKTPTEWYRYAAFGQEAVFSDENAPVNPWRFCSKRQDNETGFIFFGKRYLDPATGRWISKDPLGTPDSINRFAYVLNQPHSRVDHFGQFSVSDIWGGIQRFFDGVDFLREHLCFTNYIRPSVETGTQAIMGKTFLYLVGFYQDKSEVGIHGKGELNNNIRITMINGILNARADFRQALDVLSDSHGGINIHYYFVATKGWTQDFLKAALVRFGFGYTSPEARELAGLWKDMIEEVGGLDGNGLVIHYAHSLGATHTRAALRLLSPEEKKMLKIYTFGAPSLIKDSELHSVTNFVHYRDGVSLFDPIGFFGGLFEWNEHVTMIGKKLGIPFVEHNFLSDGYLEIIRLLGGHFLNTHLQ